MKRSVSLLLCLLFLLSLAPGAWAAPQEEPEDRETQSVKIASVADFLEFSEQCSRDVYSQNVIFSLTADIDLSGSDFRGVPYFAGLFLGNGHRIMGLGLRGDGSRQGLFRRVAEGAEIRDLTVNGTVAPGGTQQYVGGIAGVNAGKIINCSFSGTVSGIEYVGGIAGLNEATALVDHCSFAGKATGEHQVGGIAGENAGVVSRCRNNGEINTEAVVPQSDSHFDLSLLSEDDFLDLANLGGIVGNNSGVVSACKNTGAVGYKNTAYNVGGIAGKTSGYLTGCENTAVINGRRDVGGVAGQLIPYVQWDISNDKLETLAKQLGSINYLIGKAAGHASDNTSALSAELSRINGYTADAITELDQILKSFSQNDTRIIDSIHVDPETGEIKLDRIDLSGINTSGLTSVLTNLNAEASVLSGILHSSFDDLTEDMSKIIRQMSSVMGGMYSLLSSSSEGELIETRDLSSDESYEHDFGAVDSCVNSGEIYAENNAGGIVGSAAFEVSFDMEDTLGASRLLTADVSRSVFAVVRDCKSYCEVQIKSDHAGCVIGSMDVGAAVNCTGIGAVTSLSGDYVGGIAGQSQGTVRGCWSRTVLSGGKYVGGIAGLGDAIDACRCWTRIESASEYAGAVAGWSDGLVTGNLYAASSPAGIDNVSFSGMTDPISENELLALEDLPESFNDLTVRFVAEGSTVATVTVPFGGSIQELPEVENDGARYWKWDEFNREHIYHSMVVEGKFYAPGTTLSSGEDIPRFLVEGVFYEGQTLTVAEHPISDEETALAAYTLFVDGYEGELTVHMLNDADGKIYLLDSDGMRSSASAKADGKYLVFRLENGGSFVYAPADPITDHRAWIYVGAAVLVVSLTAFLLIRRRKKKNSDMHVTQDDVQSHT